MTSIRQLRHDVDRCLREALAIVDAMGDATATEVENRLSDALLELGRVVMALFFAKRAERWRAPRTYEVDGAPHQIVGMEEAEIGTRFGRVSVTRPVGRKVGVPRAARDLPLDRDVDLPGGFTLPVVTLMAKLCAHMSFASARVLFKGLFRWAPSPRAVLRMVDAAGDHARPFLEEAPPPDGDGEVLVVSVDGKGAPAISSKEYARRARPRGGRDDNGRHQRRHRRRASPRRRRAPGEKSKNAKMAAVGVLYTLKRNADGRLEGPTNKRVYATFESYRALFTWLHAEAQRRGYGTQKFSTVLFIADGADALWSLQREFFPDAACCIDWYHIAEKLWAAGKAVCRGTRRHRRELEAWVAEQKRHLRRGRAVDVIATVDAARTATPRTGPGNKFRREVLASIAAHLTKNLARMEYARLRRLDLDIGSGVVEGAARHLVGVRLDGPGMRWGRERAEAILKLRCILINGMWDDFDRFLASRQLRLAAQPVPTRTHDAVQKRSTRMRLMSLNVN